MLSKLKPVWLVGAFAVGLLLCYLMHPPPRVIVKFPSPSNAGLITYKDPAGSCYKYQAEAAACPADASKISPQPLHEDMTSVRPATAAASW